VFSIAEVPGDMDASWWLGIGVGIAIMGLHTVVRIGAHYFSLRTDDQRAFFLLELGGLGGRMLLVFGAVALVLLFVPVHPVAFVGTVIVLLIASIIVETCLMLRPQDQDRLGSS
jgi:hypothetical protein